MSGVALARTQPITEWLTKPQAAQILNCSREWIDRLIAKRLIATQKQKREGMRPLVLVNPEDVARLLGEQKTDVLLGPEKLEVPRKFAGLLEAPKPPPLPPKPFLELHDASEFCGLPYRLLLRLIARDFLPALAFNDRYYVARRDLEGLELGARKVRKRMSEPKRSFDDLLNEGEAKDFLYRAERDMLPKMEASAISLVINSDKPDIKLCLEVGAAILFDKPLLIVALKGQAIPAPLRRVATRIVEIDDYQSDAGREKLGAAITEVLKGRK